MKIIVVILWVLLAADPSTAFSTDLCTKMCYFSNALCWLCQSVHGSEETDLIELLRPVSKADLIKKAKVSFTRRQKIVGGMPVEQGQSPWTVSLKHRDGRDFYTFCAGSLISDRHVITAAHCVYHHQPYELFVGVGDWDKDVQDYGEILSAVVNIEIHPQYK